LATVFRDVLPATAAAARAGRVSTAKGSLIAQAATTPERIIALREAAPDDEPDGHHEHDEHHGQDGHDEPGGEQPGEASGPGDASGPDGAVAARDRFVGCTGEEVLLTLASGYGVRQFAKITRRFAHVADPDADERGYRAALAREFFDLAATTGGYHVSGFLTRDHGQAVKTALRAVMGVPAKGDTRTSSQRRAGALTNLARVHLDHGLTGKVATVRPHLSVHVSHTELSDLLHRTGACTPDTTTPADENPGAGRSSGAAQGANAASSTGGVDKGVSRCPHPARARRGVDLADLVTAPPARWEDGTGPIPDSVLARLAADCEITRVIFGPQSQVLNVGRTKRTFTGHLRRAVVARDQACVIDDCGAPAFMGQIHHAHVRWADGGVTSTTNAALVCAFHNQWLEDHHIPMRQTVPRQGVGRISSRSKLGMVGSARPRCTSVGRFQAIAS